MQDDKTNSGATNLSTANKKLDDALSKSFLFGWWPKTSKREKLFRKFFAFAFWFYLISKLFIYDWDVFLIQSFAPNFAWLLEYKFLLTLSIVSCIFVSTGNAHIASWMIYTLFYPFRLLFWGIVYFGALVHSTKSLDVAFASINFVLSFFTRFKSNFVLTTVVLVSCVFIRNAPSHQALWVSIVLLLLVNAVLLIRNVLSVFRPSKLYKMHVVILVRVMGWIQRQCILPETAKKLKPEQMETKQRDSYKNGLSFAILSREFCYFWARKLAEFNKSSLQLAFHLGKFLILMVITITIFAFVNYALYKVDAASFSVKDGTTFFDFFYYAFYGLFFQKPADILPASVPARCFDMLEIFYSFLLAYLFLTLIIANKRKVDEAAISAAAKDLQKEAQNMQDFLLREFSFSIQQAIDELTKLNVDVSKAIAKLKEDASHSPTMIIDQAPRGPDTG